MTKDLFNGTGVALVTPFNNNGSVDFTSLEKMVNHTIKGGVDYLVVLGTTGESVVLNQKEKKEIVDAVVQTNKKRVPIIIGIGCNDTAHVLEMIKTTDFKHIQGLLSVCPYYNKPNQTGIYEHYKAVDKASPVPVIMYNVPGRTGVNITAETTLKIANSCKNIIATKEASGNIAQCMQILKDKPKGFELISGDDAITLPLIALGAKGIISVISNAYPKEFSTMVKLSLKGDYAKALKQQYALLEIMNLIFEDGSPAGIKATLELKGLCKNILRLPLVPVNKDVHAKIQKAVHALK